MAKLTPNSVPIHGETTPRFAAVREAFSRNFSERDEIGAACAVYHRNDNAFRSRWKWGKIEPLLRRPRRCCHGGQRQLSESVNLPTTALGEQLRTLRDCPGGALRCCRVYENPRPLSVRMRP